MLDMKFLPSPSGSFLRFFGCMKMITFGAVGFISCFPKFWSSKIYCCLLALFFLQCLSHIIAKKRIPRRIRKNSAISILFKRDQFHDSEFRLIKPTSIVLSLISCPLFTSGFAALVPIVFIKIVHQLCFDCILDEERLFDCVLNFSKMIVGSMRNRLQRKAVLFQCRLGIEWLWWVLS